MVKRTSVERPEGGVIRVKLKDGEFTYGRIMKSSFYSFYDIKTKEAITDLGKIISFSIKYQAAVDDELLQKREWEIIGVVPLEEALLKTPLQANPDSIRQPDGSHKTVYTLLEGSKMRVTENKDEVIGLEHPIIWDGKCIMEILNDIYFGQPSQLKEMHTIK